MFLRILTPVALLVGVCVANVSNTTTGIAPTTTEAPDLDLCEYGNDGLVCCSFGVSNTDGSCHTTCDPNIVTEGCPSTTTMSPSDSKPTLTTAVRSWPAITGARGVPTGSALVQGGIVYQFDGCASSPKFETFALAGTDSAMTVEKCLILASSASSKYAGLNGVSCYLSAVLGALTTRTNSTDDCSTPCPGNAEENCGGTKNSLKKRQDAGVLLSLFEAVGPAPESPNGVAVPLPATPLTAGDIYISISIITYIGICDSCNSGLGPLSWTVTQTLTACGCARDSSTQSVPMVTTAAACGKCGPSGGASTATLTLPVGAPASGGPSPLPTTRVFIGAAKAIREGAVVGMVGALGVVGVGMALL